MAEELSFRCPLASGLHARPASHLVERSGRFRCAIELRNERSGERADAKSVVALVALDVRRDDPCRLRFEGSDAREARAALQAFVRDELPDCDASAPEQTLERRPLPRVLREAGARALPGTPVCPGIGGGTLVVAGRAGLPSDAELAALAPGTPAEERARAERALAGLHAELEARLAAAAGGAEAEILGAHLALARHAALHRAIDEGLAAGHGAARSVAAAGRSAAALLARSANPLVRERAIDVEDLCCQVLERLGGGRREPSALRLEEPSVVLAESLAPRQLLALDRRHLRGLLLEHAGTTSHAVILARSFGIPTLTGVEARGELCAGQQVVVDAQAGFALRADEPGARRYYERTLASLERRRAALARCAGVPARTRDGQRLELAANVASVEELEPAFASGAEGIGLFRTEMLFLDRGEPPAEEEQHALFARAAEQAGGRRLIVRTFDLGGDKPPAWLDPRAARHEANPFLGQRGVRLYPELQPLFDAHLRAILRASAAGPLQLMLPMVATPAEVRWARERLVAQQDALRRAGVPFDEELPLGIMLEVPSAAFVLDQLCAELDFFSIGTNDLAQYFLAADRQNERVAPLRDPRHPAFLRLLARIVEEIHGHGRWVGLCGEMASDPGSLPLLVGLGLDELSLAAPEVPRAKRELALLDARECRALLEHALGCRDAQEVAALVGAFRGASGGPVTARELVALDSDAASKAEVIRELVLLLHADLRTEDPLALEQAIWAREETYSTGVGGGFAVPHCKSEALSSTSLAVVRLARAVDWDALDGRPVSCAILLAVRPSDGEHAHMRAFSSLARKLVRPDFRDRILAAPDADSLLALLTGEPRAGQPPEERNDGLTP